MESEVLLAYPKQTAISRYKVLCVHN